MKLVYADTNVFVDYHQDNAFRPLKEFAFNFFREGWNCQFHLVISDWVRHETLKHISESDFEIILKDFRDKGKLHHVKQEPQDWKEAEKYAHPDDALHAILARRAGAVMIVTRNVKDFSDIDFMPVFFPESAFSPCL